MPTIDHFVDIKTVSEANVSEHWTTRRKRITSQHKIIWHELHRILPSGKISLPCKITLTRYASKEMDDDNLPTSMKYIKDAVANFIKPGLAPGQADGDRRMTWQYNQVIAKKPYGVRIEIEELC